MKTQQFMYIHITMYKEYLQAVVMQELLIDLQMKTQGSSTYT